MDQAAFRRLLQHLADTEEDEISCSECFALLPSAVELEIAGKADDRAATRLRQHLRQCGVCREEYETLLGLARLEADGQPPAADPPESL